MHLEKRGEVSLALLENLDSIKSHLTQQTIIAATKYVDSSKMKELLLLGINHFGENRAESFLEKYETFEKEKITWHFIGSLQTNKVKKIINKIDYLHSLDRLSLALEIQKYRITPLKCFIEVHISKEVSKSGIDNKEVIDFIKKIEIYDKIEVVGLMGMASNTEDKVQIESEFLSLKKLSNKIKKLQLPNVKQSYLSMGMSNDYQIAVKCNATHLRLGRILFRNEG